MLYSVWILGLLAALLYLLKKAKGCLLKSMQSLNRHCQRQFRASTHLKLSIYVKQAWWAKRTNA